MKLSFVPKSLLMATVLSMLSASPVVDAKMMSFMKPFEKLHNDSNAGRSLSQHENIEQNAQEVKQVLRNRRLGATRPREVEMKPHNKNKNIMIIQEPANEGEFHRGLSSKKSSSSMSSKGKGGKGSKKYSSGSSSKSGKGGKGSKKTSKKSSSSKGHMVATTTTRPPTTSPTKAPTPSPTMMTMTAAPTKVATTPSPTMMTMPVPTEETPPRAVASSEDQDQGPIISADVAPDIENTPPPIVSEDQKVPNVSEDWFPAPKPIISSEDQ